MTTKHTYPLVDHPQWPCCDTADDKQEIEKLTVEKESLNCIISGIAASLACEWLDIHYGDADDLPRRDRELLAEAITQEIEDGVILEELDIARCARGILPLGVAA